MFADCGPAQACGIENREPGDFCFECNGCEYSLLGSVPSMAMCDDECKIMGALGCVYHAHSKNDGECWAYLSYACMGNIDARANRSPGYLRWVTCSGAPLSLLSACSRSHSCYPTRMLLVHLAVLITSFALHAGKCSTMSSSSVHNGFV